MSEFSLSNQLNLLKKEHFLMRDNIEQLQAEIARLKQEVFEAKRKQGVAERKLKDLKEKTDE